MVKRQEYDGWRVNKPQANYFVRTTEGAKSTIGYFSIFAFKGNNNLTDVATNLKWSSKNDDIGRPAWGIKIIVANYPKKISSRCIQSPSSEWSILGVEG